jgi:acyl dehydratase
VAEPLESRYASAVGKSGDSIRLSVERGHVRRFAEAIGDAHPRYRDENAARAEGHRAIPAPPTFAIALRAPDPRGGLEVDFTKLLHGEQELLFDRPLYVGDELDVQATIVEAYAKAGKAGVMDFMVVETVGKEPSGARVFRARSLAVIRR